MNEIKEQIENKESFIHINKEIFTSFLTDSTHSLSLNLDLEFKLKQLEEELSELSSNACIKKLITNSEASKLRETVDYFEEKLSELNYEMYKKTKYIEHLKKLNDALVEDQTLMARSHHMVIQELDRNYLRKQLILEKLKEKTKTKLKSLLFYLLHKEKLTHAISLCSKYLIDYQKFIQRSPMKDNRADYTHLQLDKAFLLKNMLQIENNERELSDDELPSQFDMKNNIKNSVSELKHSYKTHIRDLIRIHKENEFLFKSNSDLIKGKHKRQIAKRLIDQFNEELELE